jgi:hypothetical protein
MTLKEAKSKLDLIIIDMVIGKDIKGGVERLMQLSVEMGEAES